MTPANESRPGDLTGATKTKLDGFAMEKPTVTVPAIAPDSDALTSALAYADAGMYVGPVKAGTKHPGSVLGNDWEAQTARDPEVIRGWFAGTDHGVFLHVGRSGLVVFDVDRPDRLHPELARAVAEQTPPFQTTRAGDATRGHYVFAVPPGRAFGNGLGSLNGGWGEVRGRNGVVVLAPSPHPEPDGLYGWARTGPVPTLPDYVSDHLPDGLRAEGTASDPEVRAFLDAHSAPADPQTALLGVHCQAFEKAVENGESRHSTMVGHLTGALKEAAADLLDATLAADTLEDLFVRAVQDDPASDRQGAARTPAEAQSEWNGLLAWAVGQARGADPDATRERSAEYLPAPDGGSTDHYDPTDIGDAHLGKRVGREYLRGHYLAWGRNRWAMWDGRCWDIHVPDDEIRKVVVEALLDIQMEEIRRADEIRDKALRKSGSNKEDADAATNRHSRRMRELKQLRNIGKIKAAMELARTQVAVRMEAFDGPQTRDYLNVGNGVVDLRTGELHPHDPDLLFTRVTPVHYRPNARHPDWDKALTAMPRDVATWIQKRFGQAATGYPPGDDIVPFFKGGGENGKTTVLSGVQAGLGEFAITLSEKVLNRNPGDHTTELLDLKGARLALLEELPEGDWLTDTNLKKATGSGRMRARAIGQNNVEWDPSHSLVVSTNHDVQVAAVDHGTWRRLAEVRFPYRYDGSDPDRPRDATLRHRIATGKDGQHEAILAWVVAGARRAYVEPLVRDEMPDTVKQHSDAWRFRGNHPAQFVDERLVHDPDCAVRSDEVYQEYRGWAGGVSRYPVSDQVFWNRAAHSALFQVPGVEKKRIRPGDLRVAGGADQGQKMRLLLEVRWAEI